MTPFAFAAAGEKDEKNITQPGCGGCHPGGGGLEYDRDGKRYDERVKAEPGLVDTLDGDYHKSPWQKTGVLEADCFICHLPGYNFGERNRQLKNLNFRWAATQASGIGRVDGFVSQNATPKIVYNKRLFNEDGKVVVDLTDKPPSENCVFCHGMSDLKKRGFSWNDPVNHEVHNMRGMACYTCHPADKNHNFAKGDENVSTVRDDLDNTMKTCKQCHYEGYMGAPRPTHASIRPNHLDKLACETCHIPQLMRAGGEGFDVTTGGMVNYAKVGAKKMGDEFLWKPRYQRIKRGQLAPVNVLLPAFYTNLETGTYHPLFAREIKKGFESIKGKLSGKEPNKPELHTPEEIGLMLTALKSVLSNGKRFKEFNPVYHKGGEKHFLDPSGKVVTEKDDSWAGHLEGFNINHNVAPAKLALGAKGCSDCHADDGHIFKGAIVTDVFGKTGKPEKTKSGLLIGCNPFAFRINQFHQAILTPYASAAILAFVFILTLHYTGQGPKGYDLRGEPGEVLRFSLAERWTHLIRMVGFGLLILTGWVFFANATEFGKIFFSSYQAVVTWHWVVGLIFFAGSLYSLKLWWKDATFTDYDREWLKKRGGYLGKVDSPPPAGRLNAGQKIFFWLTTVLSILMGVSGVLLIYKESLPLTLSCVVSTAHAVVAILFTAAVLAHAYLGTIANPGTFRALVDGMVSKRWAAKHHSEWWKEINKQ